MLSAPTCSSVETSSVWSKESSGEGQRADVSRRALHPVDVPLCKVDADELDTGAEQRGEVRHLRECVADFEHPAGRDEPREHPRDLDHALVARTRGLEPREALAACTGTEPERDGVVEGTHAHGLVRRHELVQERCARQRPGRELLDRALARVGVGWAP